MSEVVEGIMKGLEITGESPLDTVFSHKDIGTVNISRMEEPRSLPEIRSGTRCCANGTSRWAEDLRFLTPGGPVRHH